jgi:hypothetical protein
MATGDLIDRTRALYNLNNRATTSAENTTLDALITAVSAAVKRYCHTGFTSATYDELYSGAGQQRLLLRQIPVISVARVAYGPYAVIRVINNDPANQRATVAVSSASDTDVTGTGVTLVRVAAGTVTTDTSVTFAGNATLQAVVNAINALGHGWSASVPQSQYANWPSADLRIQGAVNCAGVYAEIKHHVTEISDFQVDRKRGWLIRGVNALVTQWEDPLIVWTPGIDNYRVIYTAGYATIPSDVQEATAEWVASLFWQTKSNPSAYPATPPAHVALILDAYRQALPMPI